MCCTGVQQRERGIIEMARRIVNETGSSSLQAHHSWLGAALLNSARAAEIDASNYYRGCWVSDWAITSLILESFASRIVPPSAFKKTKSVPNSFPALNRSPAI
jgi:hypothetical protein